MWIVFDIGNSSVKAGLFRGERLEQTFVLPHDAEGLVSGLEQAMRRYGGASDPVDRTGIASVVPTTTERLSTILRERNLDVTTVHHRMRLPFEMAYRTPESLGTDRLAAAAAAWDAIGMNGERSVVAIDAGTACTMEVVDRGGVYLGGVIAPGPSLLQRALHRETAQLPEVPLSLPETPVGASTTEAMQSGIMLGFIEAARGLLGRICRVLGDDPFVVATGGWSPLLLEQVNDVDDVDPHLVLRGVRVLMAMNP